MSKNMEKMREPKLRFPEFHDAGEWGHAKLRELAKRVTAKNKGSKVIRVLTNSAADGIVDQRDYFDKDIANQNNLEGYVIVDNGDYVYNPRISNLAPVGPISKNRLGTGVMSPLYSVFRFKCSDNTFYEQYFKTPLWHHYLRTISNSGARHDRMSITNDDLMDMPLPVPCTKEQQKIADFLSSIDALISAQDQNVEALKTHKQGLMQQLFPQDGETVPRLRFPDFWNAGEWDIKPLVELCDVKGGKRIPKGYGLSQEKTGLPYIRVSDMYMGGVDVSSVLHISEEVEKSIKNYKISKDDLFITVAGTIGVVGEIPDELDNANLTENANKIVIKCVVKKYLLQYLCSDHLQNLIASSITNNAQPKLSLERIRNFPIPTPCQVEQQQIADFLSNIDALIIAQSQKLHILKTHKKGLTQQMFPTADEVEV